MTDTLISLETAALAKKKGFDWVKLGFFDMMGNDILCSQSVLQKWLREKGIHVWVYPHLGTEMWYTGVIWVVGDGSTKELNNFDRNYEPVLEECLKYSLGLL